jgi:two-component system, sensor histidine kinase YesM
MENYIAIQKIRFAERFEPFFDIPDDLLDCRIIRFILQPIVENALFHGFKGKRGKECLEISAYKEEDTLYIKIQDDGTGMPEEQVAYINTYINELKNNLLDGTKESIGIKNVNSRIKLTYGTKYGITVKSKLNVGTQVLISQPVYNYRKGDAYVQNTDSR